jgi:hypothetical protein
MTEHCHDGQHGLCTGQDSFGWPCGCQCHVEGPEWDEYTHGRDEPLPAARLLRDGQYWAVEHRGRRVLGGESFTVASNVADALNGKPSPSGECNEVARAIEAAR